MEKAGLLRMPPMEPLVAAHLHTNHTAAANPTLPSKADRFQSSMTEHAYKAIAFSIRALNVTSMLTAFQASKHQPCQVRRTGKRSVSLQIFICVFRCARFKPRAKPWPQWSFKREDVGLTWRIFLTGKKKPSWTVIAEGIVGSALTLMQKRCQENKRMRLCSSVCLGRHKLYSLRHLGRSSHKLRPAHLPAIAFLDGRD